MSKHDYRVTLRQIEEYAGRAQEMAIAGMRDRLIHGYDSIKHEILWNAVHEQLPTLQVTIQQMLDDLEKGNPTSEP